MYVISEMCAFCTVCIVNFEPCAVSNRISITSVLDPLPHYLDYTCSSGVDSSEQVQKTYKKSRHADKTEDDQQTRGRSLSKTSVGGGMASFKTLYGEVVCLFFKRGCCEKIQCSLPPKVLYSLCTALSFH